jgi:hypothetical protein
MDEGVTGGMGQSRGHDFVPDLTPSRLLCPADQPEKAETVVGGPYHVMLLANAINLLFAPELLLRTHRIAGRSPFAQTASSGPWLEGASHYFPNTSRIA